MWYVVVIIVVVVVVVIRLGSSTRTCESENGCVAFLRSGVELVSSPRPFSGSSVLEVVRWPGEGGERDVGRMEDSGLGEGGAEG